MVAVLIAGAFTLPTVTALAVALWPLRQDAQRWTWFVMTLIGIAPAGIPFAWRFSAGYGLGYAILTYSIVIVMLMALRGWLPIYRWLQSAILISVTAAIVTLIPIAVLPYFRPAEADIKLPPVADARFVSESIEQIQSSIGRTIQDMQQEQQKVDAATKILLEQIDRQNATIRGLHTQRANLSKQIEYQRALVSLSQDQVNAITDSLSRGKYWDYGIGFILGIISSVVATYGTQVLQSAGSALSRRGKR